MENANKSSNQDFEDCVDMLEAGLASQERIVEIFGQELVDEALKVADMGLITRVVAKMQKRSDEIKEALGW